MFLSPSSKVDDVVPPLWVLYTNPEGKGAYMYPHPVFACTLSSDNRNKFYCKTSFSHQNVSSTDIGMPSKKKNCV